MSTRITCSECGWRSAACRSQAQAEYALRQHSCKKERARQVSVRRGRARKNAIDRTPKPCLHKIARHEHGTHACYVLDRCKCPPCAAANSAYEHRRAKDRAYGRAAYVDAQPTREHVLALRAAGMGLKTIAKVSGVPHGAVAKLVYGDRQRNLAPSKRIRWETAVKLQVVRAELATLAGGVSVDPTGTRRRVQALVAIGWSQTKIADRLGMTRSNFGHTMENGRVTVRTARAIAALYDELWDTLPPHAEWRDLSAYNRARRFAAAREWAPPLAWDNIDDPDEVPSIDGQRPTLDPTEEGWDEADAQGDTGDDLDEVLVERLMAGRAQVPNWTRSPELTEAVARLAARGLNDREIGELVGRGQDAVLQIRQRNDIPPGQPIGGITARPSQSEAATPAPNRRTAVA